MQTRIYEMMEAAGFDHVGSVAVDTGMVWIGDPLSHVPKGVTPNGGAAEIDLGALISSGYGDGLYPVFVRRLQDGTIAEARVFFVNENEK